MYYAHIASITIRVVHLTFLRSDVNLGTHRAHGPAWVLNNELTAGLEK